MDHEPRNVTIILKKTASKLQKQLKLEKISTKTSTTEELLNIEDFCLVQCTTQETYMQKTYKKSNAKHAHQTYETF